MQNQIELLTNEFWGSVIQTIDFDMLNHSINLTIKTDGKINKISFEGVSCYFFLNEDDRKSRYRFNEYGGYLELSEIYYYPTGLGKIAIVDTKKEYEKWTYDMYSSANFLLLIWNSTLLIEATSIRINNIKFDVSLEISEETRKDKTDDKEDLVSSIKNFMNKFLK